MGLKDVLREPALANQLSDALTAVLRSGAAHLSGGDALGDGYGLVQQWFGGSEAATGWFSEAAASPADSAARVGLLPQLRAAAKGHFGAHWRSSLPNEWDAKDLLLLLRVHAESRFAKERNQVTGKAKDHNSVRCLFWGRLGGLARAQSKLFA